MTTSLETAGIFSSCCCFCFCCCIKTFRYLLPPLFFTASSSSPDLKQLKLLSIILPVVCVFRIIRYLFITCFMYLFVIGAALFLANVSGMHVYRTKSKKPSACQPMPYSNHPSFSSFGYRFLILSVIDPYNQMRRLATHCCSSQDEIIYDFLFSGN